MTLSKDTVQTIPISPLQISKFEKGNPKYITGMSGYELTEVVLNETNISYTKQEPSYVDFKGREYWAGWILAYYQWKTNRRFVDIVSWSNERHRYVREQSVQVCLFSDCKKEGNPQVFIKFRLWGNPLCFYYFFMATCRPNIR